LQVQIIAIMKACFQSADSSKACRKPRALTIAIYQAAILTEGRP